MVQLASIQKCSSSVSHLISLTFTHMRKHAVYIYIQQYEKVLFSALHLFRGFAFDLNYLSFSDQYIKSLQKCKVNYLSIRVQKSDMSK